MSSLLAGGRPLLIAASSLLVGRRALLVARSSLQAVGLAGTLLALPIVGPAAVPGAPALPIGSLSRPVGVPGLLSARAALESVWLLLAPAGRLVCRPPRLVVPTALLAPLSSLLRVRSLASLPRRALLRLLAVARLPLLTLPDVAARASLAAVFVDAALPAVRIVVWIPAHEQSRAEYPVVVVLLRAE